MHAAAALCHAHLGIVHTIKYFAFGLFLFYSLADVHFPADSVTLDVITAFNLRGIRLPLTDLTAFTTRASRRL